MALIKKMMLALVIAACFALSFSTLSCTTTSKSKPDSFIEKLAACLDVGDINGALSLFDALPPEEAAREDRMLLKASVLVSAKRVKDARSTVQTVLSMNKNNIDAQFALSKIEAIEGRPKQERALLDAIIKADPNYVPALNALARLAMSAQSYKLAMNYFDRVLASRPNNLEAMIGKAQTYRFSRKPQEAVKVLNEAITAHPESALPLAERGRIYREEKRLDLAIKDFELAEKMDTGNYWIAYDKGRTLLDMNQKTAALNEFVRAEKINPHNFIAYVYSAGIRDDLGESDDALRDYEVLSKLKPDYFYAYEMRGVYYMMKKRYADAQNVFLLADKIFNAYYTDNRDKDKTYEYNYVTLAMVAALQRNDPKAVSEVKPILEQTLRKLDKSKLDYYITRLFYDFAGDADLGRRVAAEKTDMRRKALGNFYLATYYSIKGQTTLATNYYSEFKTLDRRDMIEWRFFNWVIDKGTKNQA
jgi:tetratricopeptide (TPR) repeat protein